jgi:hypothetical protein
MNESAHQQKEETMNAQVISLPATEHKASPTPKVNLGGQFTGKHEGFVDSRSGVYWESLPPIQADALKLQKGLLKPKKGSLPLGDAWRKALNDVKTNRANAAR